MFIYLLQSPYSEKGYIGQTINLGERLRTHKYDTGKNHKVNWFRKYRDSIEIKQIAEVDNNEADKWEIFYINFFRNMGMNLTNVASGGFSNWNHSEETKKRISMAQKGKILSKEHAAKVRLTCDKNKTNQFTCDEIRNTYLKNKKHGIIKELSEKYNLNRFTLRKIINYSGAYAQQISIGE